VLIKSILKKPNIGCDDHFPIYKYELYEVRKPNIGCDDHFPIYKILKILLSIIPFLIILLEKKHHECNRQSDL